MSSDKVNEFCQVTGSDEQTAARFLSACNENLEMAVSLFMDSPNVSSNANVPGLDDNCRSPIPQRTEQLLPVEIPVYGMRFLGSTSNPSRGTNRAGTSRRRPVFLADDSDDDDDENGWHDRDTKWAGSGAEATRENSELGIKPSTSRQPVHAPASGSSSSSVAPTPVLVNGCHAAASAGPSTRDGGSCRVGNGGGSGCGGDRGTARPSATGASSTFPPSTAPSAKRRRENLRQLYRPPTELLFDGNMSQAIGAARAKVQWLLVSLHDEGCFDCHILNRDVWKDSKVFMLIRQSFTFIQIPVDSPDGVRYRSHYPYVNSATHMAVLDPFSGEQKMMWMHLKDPGSVYDVLSEFLTHNRLTSTTGDSWSSAPSTSTSTNRPMFDGYPLEPATKRPRTGQLDGIGGISVGVAAVSLAGNNHASSSRARLCDDDDGNHLADARVNPLDLSEEEQLRLAIEASKAAVNVEAADAISTVTISDADENDNSDVDDDLIILTDDDESSDKVVMQRKASGYRPSVRRYTSDRLSVDAASPGGSGVVTSTAFVTGRRPLWPMSKDSASGGGGSVSGGATVRPSVEPLPSVLPGEPVIELAVRLPSGAREVHSLSPALSLQVLLAHFASRGLPPREYELIRLYPRVVLSQLPGGTTLGEMGLAKKDAVFIQPK